MKAILIHNPTAGFENHSREELIRILSEEGYEAKYVNSKEEDVGKVLKNPGEMVIVAGGDGTIAKAAGHLVGKNVPMGVLPLGTANNIASTLKSLHLPRLGTEKQNNVKHCTCDVGAAVGNGKKRYFFESSGFGLFANSIAESSNEGKKRTFKSRKEKITFGLDILKNILEKQPAEDYQVILDGKDYSGKYLMLEIMNIRSIGPNIAIAPDANPGDGFFDIVLIAEQDRSSFAQYLSQLSTSEEVRFEHVTYQASKINVRSQQPQPAFHIDDELIEVEGNGILQFTVEASKLEFVWIY